MARFCRTEVGAPFFKAASTFLSNDPAWKDSPIPAQLVFAIPRSACAVMARMSGAPLEFGRG